jgi:hypothetical protein
MRIRDFLHASSTSPSSLGTAEHFRDEQEKKKSFYFERPLSAAHDVPVTLLHPIFGNFQHDCKNHIPTREDNLLTHDLRTNMSKIFATEKERSNAFIAVLKEHKIEARGSMIHNGSRTCHTDADIQINEFRIVIFQFKNELGSQGAEPLFQAMCYYQRGVAAYETHEEVKDSKMAKHWNSPLPCLLVYMFGLFRPLLTVAITDSNGSRCTNQFRWRCVWEPPTCTTPLFTATLLSCDRHGSTINCGAPYWRL